MYSQILTSCMTFNRTRHRKGGGGVYDRQEFRRRGQNSEMPRQKLFFLLSLLLTRVLYLWIQCLLVWILPSSYLVMAICMWPQHAGYQAREWRLSPLTLTASPEILGKQGTSISAKAGFGSQKMKKRGGGGRSNQINPQDLDLSLNCKKISLLILHWKTPGRWRSLIRVIPSCGGKTGDESAGRHPDKVSCGAADIVVALVSRERREREEEPTFQHSDRPQTPARPLPCYTSWHENTVVASVVLKQHHVVFLLFKL